MKQHLPAKPQKRGYMRVNVYVVMMDFLIISKFILVTIMIPKLQFSDEPDLVCSANNTYCDSISENIIIIAGGFTPDLVIISANIVVRLCKTVSTNKNYTVQFDNFYTSVALLQLRSFQSL